MAIDRKPYDADIPPGSPSAETRSNFSPKDVMIRERGFTIYARPKGKPAVWTRGGVLYSQAQVEAELRFAGKKK